MVCLGNICRSPMAEGIFRDKVEKKKLNILVDSAGTSNYHVDEAPDARAIATARKFGVDISGLRGRQFTSADFDHFDRIYVMDHSNLKNVLSLARTKEQEAKVSLLLNVLSSDRSEVPDPWFGGAQDFIDVFHLLDRACEKLAAEIASEMTKA